MLKADDYVDIHLCSLVVLVLLWCKLYDIYRANIRQKCWKTANSVGNPSLSSLSLHKNVCSLDDKTQCYLFCWHNNTWSFIKQSLFYLRITSWNKGLLYCRSLNFNNIWQTINKLIDCWSELININAENPFQLFSLCASPIDSVVYTFFYYKMIWNVVQFSNFQHTWSNRTNLHQFKNTIFYIIIY